MALPKTFTGGERLFAADLNSNFEDLDTRLSGIDTDDVAEGSVSRYVKRFADASARSTAIPSPAEGMVSYLDDANVVQVYDGSAWATVGNAGIGSNVVVGSETSGVTSTSTSFVSTNLSATITPSSATSKILVVYSLSFGLHVDSSRAVVGEFRLLRDANVLATDSNYHYSVVSGATGKSVRNAIGVVLDSPASTSALTYEVEIRTASSGNNRTVLTQATDGNRIILIEVAA